MKIFVIGTIKTGTKSIGAALELLGFGKRHSFDLDLTRLWAKGNIDVVLEEACKYDILEDWPWPLIYREAAIKFPEAKFILSMRSSDSVWYKSLVRHSKITGPTKFRQLIFNDYKSHPDQGKYINYYNRHNHEVMEFFDTKEPTRLLKFCIDNGDSWEKLCGFLGKEIPNFQFPHENKSQNYYAFKIKEKLKSIIKRFT